MNDPTVKIIENATPGDVRAGDYVVWECARESGDATFTERREGIVHNHDRYGDWYTKDGIYLTLGAGEGITITIRRPVQELPTEPGTVLEAADGHEYITATFAGEVYRAREAILRVPDHWHAAWRSDTSVMASFISGWIDPGTWKVDDR